MEEWKTKGELLQELDALRGRISELERVERNRIDGEPEELGRRFKRIFDNFTEGVFLTDLEAKRLVAGNKAICQMLGYDVEDIENLEIQSICPSEDSSHLIEQFEKQVSGELVFRKDVPIRRKDGDLFYADIISIPLTLSGKIFLLCFLKETSSHKVKSVSKSSTFLDSYPSQPLTETEIKVLKSIAQGMSNKEIARLFRRSIRTIENHRAHIMKKLRVDSSIELIKRAVAMKLVDMQEDQGPRNTT